MAKKKPNPLVRTIVPLILLAASVGVFFLMARTNPTPSPSAQPASSSGGASQPAPDQPDPGRPPHPSTDGRDESNDAAPSDAPLAGDTQTPAPQPDATIDVEALRAAVVPESERREFSPLGSALIVPDGVSIDNVSPYRLGMTFSPLGAGIDSIRFTRYFQTVRRERHDVGQQSVRYDPPAGGAPTFVIPFSALQIVVEGRPVLVTGSPSAPVWRETAPGVFVAEIIDSEDRPALRFTREFVLAEDSYDLTVNQRIENLTDAPLSIALEQLGPIELPEGTVGYGGDKRRLRFGYILDDPSANPGRAIESTRFVTPRNKLLQASRSEFWPPRSDRPYALVWTALVNRYFGVAVHTRTDDTPPADPVLQSVERVRRLTLDRDRDPSSLDDAVAVLELVSPVRTVGPGDSADFSLGVYAGPLTTRVINENAALDSIGLDGIVLYSFGGLFACCTFAWLADLLRVYLGFLEAYVLFDWSLAIIVLVFTVRTILHPVTKYSQTSLQRFSKKMQALGPKQKKLQERYKDDPQKLRQEMARLMKEEGVNPAQALGCLPMFLQTPVWIALYAMLYFTFELRHEAAFFGLFQNISGGSWTFLSDLAEPDAFVPLGRYAFDIPLLSNLMGTITAINLLPLLLGVVFYAHQKYLSPPPSTSLSPEQEQTQKIMRVIFPVMFPIFMYNAPAGLSLYFITNSTIAIFESRLIRRHAEALKEKERLNPKSARPKKRSGFMERLARYAEEKQRQHAQQRKGRLDARGSGPQEAQRRRVQNRAAGAKKRRGGR